MKYMLLAYSNTANWDESTLSEADVQRICEFYERFEQELRDRGEFVTSEGLTDPSHAVALRRGDSGTAVATDGPLIEAKETLVSFSIIDVDSMERAVHIAAQVTEATGDAVEVRPVMDVNVPPDA